MATADVVLFLHRVSTSFDKDSEENVEVNQPFEVHLHSNVLKESRYFVLFYLIDGRHLWIRNWRSHCR